VTSIQYVGRTGFGNFRKNRDQIAEPDLAPRPASSLIFLINRGIDIDIKN